MFRRCSAVAALVLALVPAATPAQVAFPPPPEKFDATIRYRAPAGRNERIREHRAMTAFFESLGFAPAEREDADLDIFDPVAERTHGTIPAANAAKLLNDPRVLGVVLVPAGTAIPDDPQKPLQVRIALARGLEPAQQKQLHGQSAAKLAELGFKEGVGYDHVGYTRLRGTLPAGNLFGLLRDLRYQPAGWFVPQDSPAELPLPLRSVYPVRLVEVLPELPQAEAMAPPVAVADPNAGKLTDDLRAVFAVPGNAEKPLQVEVVFDAEPLGGLKDLEHTFRSTAAGALPDGLVGAVGSAQLKRAADALKVAELPEVKAIRLPRAGHPTARPIPADADGVVPVAKLIAESRVGDLHAMGYKGEGVRVVVIGAGFPGAAELAGNLLPAKVKTVDLTAELDPALLPSKAAPHAGGTAAAAAVHAAAPAAELTLVRVDPAAFHQLLTVARAVAAEGANSIAMQARSGEMGRRSDELAARRSIVMNEYQAAFADLSDEAGPTRRRAAAADTLAKLRAEEKELRETVARFNALKFAVDDLKGADLVVNSLVWEDGYPNDGLSELSQYIGTRFVGIPTRSAIKAHRQPLVPGWVQAGSAMVGSVWAGPYLDQDRNKTMEFAPRETAIPAKLWTRELNFLGLKPLDGAGSQTLPAGYAVRISVQWREPHDPNDVFAPDPVYPLRLRVLRQLDPDGKAAATDELQEVAASTGPTVRLLRTPTSGVYELSMVFTVPEDGVYALRVERLSEGDTFLSARREEADYRVRIVLTPHDEASIDKGRAVFTSFAPRNAGVGIPGDTPAALTVGIGGEPGFTVPESLTATGPGVSLGVKPDLLTAGAVSAGDRAAAGPGAAAGFVGGAAASLRSAGLRATDIVRTIGMRQGGPLLLPQEWLSHVRPDGGRTER